jgi:hypothetical protein
LRFDRLLDGNPGLQAQQSEDRLLVIELRRIDRRLCNIQVLLGHQALVEQAAHALQFGAAALELNLTTSDFQETSLLIRDGALIRLSNYRRDQSQQE